MRQLLNIISRNLKLYFKNKGLFLSSLISPLILLILYITFLGKIYKDSLYEAIPLNVNIDTKIIEGLVAGYLISSIISVSCVTISFCSNLIMINDKASRNLDDFYISPVSKRKLAFGYFVSSFISTIIVIFITLIVGFIYIYVKGWYLSADLIIKIVIDSILLTLFGTSLSSIINFFLDSNAQASALGTIVSSLYGFICGAYMPISNFDKGLQNGLSFLPGTYGTSLIRYHFIIGPATKINDKITENILNNFDANIFLFNNKIDNYIKYIVLIISIIVFASIYVVLNVLKKKREK